MKGALDLSAEIATTPWTSVLVDRVCDGVLDGEFSVAFQPIIDVQSGCTVGAEALLRWQHPDFGELLPEAFAKALLTPVAAWATTAFVIDEVCRQLSESLTNSPISSRGAGSKLQFVSLNVLPSQLYDGKLEAMIRYSTAKHRVSPSMILIELLECEPVSNLTNLQQEIEKLQNLGVRVAIDDFGCGSWSLNDLASLRIDVVKITGKIVNRSTFNSRTKLILGSMVSLFTDLDIATIIEGIESTEQRAWIEKQSSIMAQGYIFARPQASLRSALNINSNTPRFTGNIANHEIIRIKV